MEENTDTKKPNNNQSLVISYLKLRKAIGFLGIGLPIILVMGVAIAGADQIIKEALSNYYYTEMRDFFVGILCAIAVFLFSYTGYDTQDNIAGDLAGVFALGIAFFPTSASWTGTIHLVSAILFFLVLAYFSLFLFTKGNPNPTPQKQKRNKVYKVCGYIMLGSLVLMLLYGILPAGSTIHISTFKPIFWLETLALWAFGVSWLTKGEFLLSDAQNGK